MPYLFADKVSYLVWCEGHGKLRNKLRELSELVIYLDLRTLGYRWFCVTHHAAKALLEPMCEVGVQDWCMCLPGIYGGIFGLELG